jgi:hypothetical protein
MPQAQVMEHARVPCGQVGDDQMRLLEPELAVVQRHPGPEYLVAAEDIQRKTGGTERRQQYMLIQRPKRRAFLATGDANGQQH